jgi:hypothetical protein
MIHKKLIEARAKLRAVAVKKSGWNSFSEYKYLELGDFLHPTLKICDDLGVCGVVSYTADIASLTLTDVDDGTQIVITSPMGSAKLKASHEVQNIGAVETYQRRYLWITAMELVEHDALDRSPGADDSLVPVLEASIEQAKQKRQGVMGAVLDDINLDNKTKTALAKLAFEVGEAFKHPEEGAGMAYDRIEIEELNSDEKLYLWSMLDSKIRSALKREQQTRALTKETA